MDEESLVEFLKSRLSVSVKRNYGSYGSSDSLEFELLLDGEVISSDHVYLDND